MLNKVLGVLGGGGVNKTIETVGNAVDQIFTSDEERLNKKEVLAKLDNKIKLGQIDINKIDARSKSFWQSGWRPSIGWSCSVGVFYSFVLSKMLEQLLQLQPVKLETDQLLTLLGILLGTSCLRTYEKRKGIDTE